MPVFSLELGGITQPEYALDEILSWLENADKPCVVAIDEFQRIGKYSEQNVEALLRGKIQHLSNCHFIFSGSEPHLLAEMFQTPKRPFYHSTSVMSLQTIAMDVYRQFAMHCFEMGGRSLSADAFDALYRYFDGNTFCLQKILHESYNMILENECCDSDLMQQCLMDILSNNANIYREMLSRMTTKQKAVLTAIAIEGKAEKVTSGAFLRRHDLESASMVQTALRILREDEWVSMRDQMLVVSDPFLALWLQQQHGALRRIV